MLKPTIEEGQKIMYNLQKLYRSGYIINLMEENYYYSLKKSIEILGLTVRYKILSIFLNEHTLNSYEKTDTFDYFFFNSFVASNYFDSLNYPEIADVKKELSIFIGSTPYMSGALITTRQIFKLYKDSMMNSNSYTTALYSK